MAPSKRGRLVPLFGAGVALALLACNGILGISDYERGECSGGGLCFDSGAPDGARDGAPDVLALDASGTKPVRWAHFVMPNYDAGAATENVPTYAVG
ncbi:MAG: hypothetical protein K0S65_4892, partial [Labilithrix sp.]|nr:hypothetical protein [Labilithrix sp.]